MKKLKFKDSPIQGITKEAWSRNGTYRSIETWSGSVLLSLANQELGHYPNVEAAHLAAQKHFESSKEKN